MRRGTGLALIAAAGTLAVVAPAAAQASHPLHPAHPSHPTGSHKCAPHKVAYVASGQFVSWAATQAANGTWTGTITIHVTRANHHAANAKGDDVSFTLSNSKVTFGNGANPPAAGDPVHLIGKISEVAKKCTQSGPALPIAARKVIIRAPTPRP